MENEIDRRALENAVEKVFFSDAGEKLLSLSNSGGRFVHYTSAEVAISIIQNKEIWMRNAKTMNDFSEVEHGISCIVGAWHSDVGVNFRQKIDSIHPGTCEAAAKLFESWKNEFLYGTYSTCVSEHPPGEDDYGRLSMWRAYGGRSGVALVLNSTPFSAETNELAAYSVPVFYGGTEEYIIRLESIYKSLEEEFDNIKLLNEESLRENIFQMLRFSVLSTKHPAFKEEREWRVIYSPNMEPSPVIRPEVKVVRGIPQIVQVIPLRDDPANGLVGADIPSLIHRVIIGPTEDLPAVYGAFVEVLRAANVEDPASRIRLSKIPLRHQT